MRRRTLFRSFSTLACAFLCSQTHAAAFQFYELGTPIIGTAAVGQATVAQDASTAYFNPAAMTRLNGSQYMLGSQLLVPYNNFSVSSNNTIVGNNGGDAGTLVPGMDLYYVYSYSPALKLGVSLNSPYGGMLTYNDGWVGRYVVQTLQLFTLDLNPAIAYQVNEWLSIGAGGTVEYANLHQTLAIPYLPDNDGQINLKLADFKPGYNAGILLTPTPYTRIGVTYRSNIRHHLSGNTTFLRLNVAPSTSTKMIMPQNVIASLQYLIRPDLTFIGEAGWANWSTMQNTIINIYNYSAATPRDWKDTYRFGLAAIYNYNYDLLFQIGASFDSSPTTTSRRLPDLPMDRQIRGAAGLIYTVFKNAQLGFSYEYINLGHAAINNTLPEGVLAGNYSTRNYANVFQASINVGCA